VLKTESAIEEVPRLAMPIREARLERNSRPADLAKRHPRTKNTSIGKFNLVAPKQDGKNMGGCEKWPARFFAARCCWPAAYALGVHKKTNEALSYFLKICANSTSYGMFYELTPQKQRKPVKVHVFSGDHDHEQYVETIEKPGEWYFPPIASLITGGAHLFLAMLERCITDQGGHYLFCDTDSMYIVASRTGGQVACPNEPWIKALSWTDVEDIAARFKSLNCYDRTKVRGSILKIEKVNFDEGEQVELFGFATSAKRYVLYRYDKKGNILIVDAKLHGLGYLYPPQDFVDGEPESDWILQAWHWVLEGE
jgi:hypothetical protein